MSSNLDYLTDKLKSKDKKVLIQVLASLRTKVTSKNTHYIISSANFKIIISFLKSPNHKLLNYTISILGNCCLHERYRKDFNETEGFSDLLLILDCLMDDDIACRAWRLVGNLVKSVELCRLGMNLGLPDRMDTYVSQIDTFSSGTRLMIFRAIEKCWVHKFTRTNIANDKLSEHLKDCLKSEDTGTVLMTLKLLAVILSKSNVFMIDRPIIVQLVELSKKSELNIGSMKCLAAIVIYRVFSHLIEGTGIAEVFIEHLTENALVDRVILEALYKLCHEGAIRNKIKTANLFPRLIRLCRGPNLSLLLNLFLLFQYDQPSLQTLSQSEELLDVLVNSVASSHAATLLTLFARLDDPIPALVTNQNLDTFIASVNCGQLLATLARSKKYFKTLLLSDKVWALSRSGCLMETVGSSGYGEGVVEHCLLTGDEHRKKVVALAVPFLVEPRNFQLLYKLLARHSAMEIILKALRNTPMEDRVVAAIVRLAAFFRKQHRTDDRPTDVGGVSLLFLEESANCDSLSEKSDLDMNHRSETSNCLTSPSRVTFELDDGTSVMGPRAVLCAESPVLDAMLNGHFAEAGKDRVKLANCSRAGLTALVRLLENRLNVTNLEIDTHLELVSLTDRLLMPVLSDDLTRAVQVSGSNCAHVYLWAQRAGSASNATRLRARAYWELLSGAEQLLPALRKPECREPLVNDITEFLTACLRDLL